MTREMQFKEVTLRLGFWEDADGFPIGEDKWRSWLYDAVRAWHHKVGPHMSVQTRTHTQTVLDDDEIRRLLNNE